MHLTCFTSWIAGIDKSTRHSFLKLNEDTFDFEFLWWTPGTLHGSFIFSFWTSHYFCVLWWMHIKTSKFFSLYSVRKLLWRWLLRNILTLKSAAHAENVSFLLSSRRILSLVIKDITNLALGIHQSESLLSDWCIPSCDGLRNSGVVFTVHVYRTSFLQISEAHSI